ncbi:MAG: hypothetical protein Q7S07_01100 [Candidatus Omnitrophota bacterium]|nr:hypothetical protein [Candidatus Omnitrophota bacterium]
MGVYSDLCGFGKRNKSVTGQKKLKRKMVQAMVKKLKAEGKPIDLQAVNKEVFDKVRRKHQSQRKKHQLIGKEII